MTKFSDVVAEAERRSAIKGPRAISRAAKAKGFTLSHGTVSKALNGTHGNVTDETVKALAAVLPVTEAKLYGALGVERAEPYEAPAAADRLTTVQRELINALIHQIVRPEEGTGSGTPAKKSPSGGDELKKRRESKTSEPDESVVPAADRVDPDADEPPGGSDDLD